MMTSSTQNSTWLISKGLRLLLALLLVVSIGTLASVGGSHWVRTQAWRQVTESPPQHLETRLEGLLLYSPNPGQDLARAISSERLDLSQTGIKVFQQRLDQWSAKPAVEFRDQLAQCVIHLAMRPESLSSEVLYPLIEQLRRLNHWQLALPPKLETRFAVALETLIRQEALAERELWIEVNPPPAGVNSEIIAWNTPAWEHSPVASSADFPPFMAQVEYALDRPGASRSVGETPRSKLEAASNPPDRLPSILPDSPAVPRPLLEARRSDPPPLYPLESAPLFELVWKLRDREAEGARAANAELRRRGFTDAHLGLAMEITQPDAIARTAVVRRLPTMPGIQATAWLYLMTKDPDETVRYLATAMLMTSRDPRLQKQIRADLATDPSPRVRELISR